MTKPLNSQLSQRESPQPRSARRPRTWLVALLGFGAADLLVLNLWAVPNLITNRTTTDMRAAHSGESEPQPQAAVAAQPADAHAAHQHEPPSQLTHAAHPDGSPSEYGARAAQQGDSAAQAAHQDDRTAQQGESHREQGEHASQPAAAARGDDATPPQRARSAHQADATSSRGTRSSQQLDTTPAAEHAAKKADGTAAYPSDHAAEEGAVTQQREAAARPEHSATPTTQQREAAARPGDSAARSAQQRGTAARLSEQGAETPASDLAARTEQQRTNSAAQAQPQRAAAHGDTAEQATQRGAVAAPADPAAQAAQQRGSAAHTAEAAQQAASPENTAEQAAQQREAAMGPGNTAAQAAEQREAAARPEDPAQQRGARPNDSAAQAAQQREAANDVATPDDARAAAEYAAQQGAAVGEPAAAARDDWASRAPRAEAPPGGAPPSSREVADMPSDPAAARAFAVRAAQRAVRVALADRTAFRDDGPFDALTVADQPLTQIFFSLGNYTLGPNGRQTLERKLPQLTSDQRPILIVGAADPSGPEQVNEKLSDARAQSVAEWLLAHGVDAQRIQTHAIGHEGAVGSTLDRRVDIWLGGSR